MSSTTTLKAVLVGQDKSMGRTFTTVGNKAEKTGRKVGFGGSFAKLAGPIGLGIGAIMAGGAAVGKFTDFLGDSITEAREAEKVGKTTAQIIKSTGGAAKVSAKQVADLAGRISEKAGVDDEAIQSGANLLLTFKNVRNEAGKGAAIFDRATQAAADLSAAGFGSINGSSKMLGKALNDPIKGISALGRAGVTFSEDQKKAIKKMVETGDVLGAQKIILGEVESQVGGVAAASASMSDKVKVSWDNLKERIGTALLPALDKLGNWFLNKGLPAIQRFGGWVKDKLWPALKDGWDTVQPGLSKAKEIILGAFGGDSSTAMKDFATILTDKVIPVVADVVNVWLPAMATQWRAAIEVVKAAWKTFEFWGTVVRKVTSVILGAFIKVTRFGADMLDALSHVPGFGWAKDAADKLRNAANKGQDLKNVLDGLPRNIDIWVRTRQTGRITLPDGTKVNVGQRGHGGPVRKGMPYAVGDNPDGSWNKTTELFVPNQSGRILTQKQIAAAANDAAATAGGGFGRLHPHDIAAIVDGFARSRPVAVMSTSAADAALAVGL